MVEFLGISAAVWGVVMALAPILQIRRMLARRSSADVSLAYLAVLQFGFALWIAYGLAAHTAVLVVPNAMAFAVGALAITVAWRLRGTATARQGGVRALPERG